MKIKILTACLSLFLFISASPWEGAGIIAPEGSLPATGFFIATNSFPGNTLVEITNVDTNRSVRALVNNTLDTPGLLATVSREAADLIGMQHGVVSRIRISQPLAPLASQRFSETVTLPANRDPDIRLAGEHGAARPYFLEPEWNGGALLPIIDLPAEQPPLVHEPVVPAPLHGFFVDSIPEVDVTDDVEITNFIPSIDRVEKEDRHITTGFIASIDRAEETDKHITTGFIASIDRDTDIDNEAEHLALIREFNIVPTKERPPVHNFYEIDPALVIAGVIEAPPQAAVMPEIDPAFIIPGIVRAEPPPQAAPRQEPVLTLPPAVEIPFRREPEVFVPEFSVPRIFQLERGRFYVQIAAFESAASVENLVRQIDNSYQPVVYKDGDHRYRVLLGPMNQGESAAVLRRFRSIGYRDAFVRQGR